MVALDYINLTPQELGKLLSAGNGDAALLYLYMKATGDMTLRYAERELHIPIQNLQWAESLLKRLGLMEIPAPVLRYDREKAPVYTGEEVAECSARDPGFALLQGEVSRRLGRILTGEELKILLSLRNYLKMPPEVVSMALTHCLQRNEYYNKAGGRDRTVTMRMLEKECYDWANKGILTLEQASAYSSQKLELLAPESQVKRAIGLESRPLVDAERQYIEGWLQMGFPVETIKEAYDKTVLSTGKLAWKYMNKILLNWHEKNLHTLQEVKSSDRKQPAAVQDQSFTPGQEELAAVRNLRKLRTSGSEE